MRNDWILDVLTDLRTFAEQNGMDASAEHLADACLVVATELANKDTGARVKRASTHEVEFREGFGNHPEG
jgi:hypothetical protein